MLRLNRYLWNKINNKKQVTTQTFRTESDADSLSWCFAGSKLQKSETNDFIEGFAHDGVKYCFDSSCIMALLAFSKRCSLYFYVF